MSLFLGVDGGGTHSRALVVNHSGNVLGRADGGPANYQTIGLDAAKSNLLDVTARAVHEAASGSVDFAAFGMSGADRPKDYAAIETILPGVARVKTRLVNDSQLVLRAGTEDGVGIGVVSGTGTNALGCDATGRVERVGGFCYELGDFGSGGDLGREALRAAMRGRDGRGRPTALYDLICDRLGVRPLEDVIDRWMASQPDNDLHALAPLVFQAAASGDDVACGLLAWAGRELALSIEVLANRLFADGDRVVVVLGGSVLQRGRDPTLIRTIRDRLDGLAHRFELRRLRAEPVFGAILLAYDLIGSSQEATITFRQGLAASIGGGFAEPV